MGSLTLMVTLLGVIGKAVASPSSISEDCDAFWTPAEVVEVLARTVLEGVALNGSADMLLWARSPLSKRGRFRVLGESASSMRFLCGELGPADCARVDETGRRVKPESMTW